MSDGRVGFVILADVLPILHQTRHTKNATYLTIQIHKF